MHVTVHAAPMTALADDGARAACRALLSRREDAHCDTLGRGRRHDEYLQTRALVRRALSRRAPKVAPASWQFAAGADGKPYIVGPQHAPPLAFNVTHTDGLCACAVADDGIIGIDVETLDRSCPVDAIAERCFTPSERAAMRALPPDERRRRFFELWTLKEAYLKALGVGVTLPLRAPSFVLTRAEPIGVERTDDPREPGAWRFAHVQMSARHLVAIAASPSSGRGAEVTIAVASQ